MWIYERSLSVYIRRSNRFLSDKSVPALDIASVEVDQKYRGMGIFTSFLNRFEAAASELNRAVFVENILNARLVTFLMNRGYIKYPGSVDICPSVIKLLP